MEGEDGSEAAAMREGSFASKSRGVRTLVLAAGSLMNLVLAPPAAHDCVPDRHAYADGDRLDIAGPA
jgi:hypothetical protein